MVLPRMQTCMTERRYIKNKICCRDIHHHYICICMSPPRSVCIQEIVIRGALRYSHSRIIQASEASYGFITRVKKSCCLFHYSSQGFGFSSSKGCPVCSAGMAEHRKGVLDLPKLIRAKSVYNICLF